MAAAPARLRWPHTGLAGRLPGLCAICRSWGSGRVCADCLGRYATGRWRCARCALPLESTLPEAEQAAAERLCGACLTAPPPYDAAIAGLDYAPPWDRLITDFKFHGALELAPVFATALLASIAADARPLPGLVLPVPLAAARLRERGYNQAWEVARRVAARLGLAALPSLLLRVRDTAHQLALPPAERAGNVHDAFAVEPLRRSLLTGCHAAIVDDVMTTGHTAAELARVLTQAGAARVSIWVVARTARPGDA